MKVSMKSSPDVPSPVRLGFHPRFIRAFTALSSAFASALSSAFFRVHRVTLHGSASAAGSPRDVGLGHRRPYSMGSSSLCAVATINRAGGAASVTVESTGNQGPPSTE